MSKQAPEPLIVTHLFPEMRAELLRVLHSLSDEDWQRPTACEGWSVKDVAAHLLADDIGYLSRHRDREGITFKVESWDELLRLINDQNETWVRWARRLSRRLLMSFLEFTGEQLAEYLPTVDLFAMSGPVSWAGSDPVPMWMQVARELTEYWMHHQHICEAVGVTSLKDHRFLHPVLSTFVYSLQRTYENIDAPPDTVVKFTVTGIDSWFVIREENRWRLYADTDITPAAAITLDDQTAWRLFTKGMTAAEAQSLAKIEGDTELGQIALNSVAILA